MKMKKTILALSILGLVAFAAPRPAAADVAFSIGLPGFSLYSGPPVVAAPPVYGPPVVYAPPVYYARPYPVFYGRPFYGRPFYRPYFGGPWNRGWHGGWHGHGHGWR